MRHILACLLALGLLFSCAVAQEGGTIASYVMPEGAQLFYLPMGEAPEAVEGLEPMYELMMDATLAGNVYLLQMPGGHALASVSCIPVKRGFTAQELLDLWPQIAQEISLDVVWVDGSEACAAVETLRGIEKLRIRTEIVVGEESAPIRLSAEALAFCQDQAITEIWLVHPLEEGFAGDQEMLKADVQALEEFKSSLTFPGGDVQLLSGVPYQDQQGRFEMIMPADGVVIDASTADEAIEETRSRFVQANPEGAERIFERLLGYVYETDSVLIFTGDMQGVIEVSATRMEELSGMKPDQLSMMAEAIEESMAQEYDLAVLMTVGERMWISNQEHALLGYWLRAGETDMQLDLMICVCDGWLYEVDVYAAEGDQEVRGTLHAYASQSMVYTPPVNALE